MLRVGKILLEKQALNRCERHRTRRQALVDPQSDDRARFGRQTRDSLVLENLFGSEMEAGLVGPGDDLNAEDGVTAECKEAVVDAHPLDAENLGPDFS